MTELVQEKERAIEAAKRLIWRHGTDIYIGTGPNAWRIGHISLQALSDDRYKLAIDFVADALASYASEGRTDSRSIVEAVLKFVTADEGVIRCEVDRAMLAVQELEGRRETQDFEEWANGLFGRWDDLKATNAHTVHILKECWEAAYLRGRAEQAKAMDAIRKR